ncbi:MAG TPA: DUF2269 family protein [Acidimicrobiales bacterium]|jgi:hypothetical protein|nr:DUF2269 family protein [Acidimicrobiales bacterium]
MQPAGAALVALSSSRGAAYDVVLLGHVLSAVIGFGAVAVAGGYALLLRRPGSPSASVLRYYRPGVNWAGRVTFLVPVLGVALVAMSHGQWSYNDHWVIGGLALWAAAAVAGEMMVWPAERELQRLVTEGAPDSARRRSLVRRAAGGGAAMMIVFVVALVIMVAKP